jgi:predicted dehydrogenase
MRSVHHLLKTVAGQPNLRPAWFFDIHQQGEGITDVGTHLVDLVQWMVAADTPIYDRRDIQVLDGRRWATVLTAAEFERVTGESAYPDFLKPAVREGRLEYFCNSLAEYAFRGIHTRLELEWRYEAPEGAGDTESAIFRGSRSRVELRQGPEEKYRPEVYVVPNGPAMKAEIRAAVSYRLEQLGAAYPGLGLRDSGNGLLVTIPDGFRIGHEAHFSRVSRRFLQYVNAPASIPQWEESFMLAKYYTATKALELARAHPAAIANR